MINNSIKINSFGNAIMKQEPVSLSKNMQEEEEEKKIQRNEDNFSSRMNQKA
jgi:hypothetical protein